MLKTALETFVSTCKFDIDMQLKNVGYPPFFVIELNLDFFPLSDHIPASEVVSHSLSLHRGLVRISEGRVQLALEQGWFASRLSLSHVNTS